MRTLAFLHKTTLENLREWRILVVTLLFAPCFVFLMYGYFQATAPAYRLLVVDHDDPPALPGELILLGSVGLLAAWEDAAHPDGEPVFSVIRAGDLDTALATLARRDADLVVEIPAGYTQHLLDYVEGRTTWPAHLTNHADSGSSRSTLAMAMADYTAFSYVAGVTGDPSPLDIRVRMVGAERQRSGFDLYVPALLVLALIMVLFTAAATLIAEVDRGTMTRLVLSRLHVVEILAAVSIAQVGIGLASLALTWLAATALGFHAEGSLLAVLVVGALTTLSVVAIAVILAAFLRTLFELLTVGCFPFFVLMFFSDCMFPLPKATVAVIGGFTVYATDALPTALAVRALGRILDHGAGLGDVWPEIAGIAALTAVYFTAGACLFHRRHLRIG